MGDYRPISLLPAISKLFERVLFNQIYGVLKKNNLYQAYASQCGFRDKHSTELAAAGVIDRVIKKMDSNEIPIRVNIQFKGHLVSFGYFERIYVLCGSDFFKYFLMQHAMC